MHQRPADPNRIQAALKTSFGIEVSVGHINHVRAKQGVTKQKRGQAQTPVKKLNEPLQPVWQEGLGSLLLLAATQQTGLLEALVRAIMEVAGPTIPGLSPVLATEHIRSKNERS